MDTGPPLPLSGLKIMFESSRDCGNLFNKCFEARSRSAAMVASFLETQAMIEERILYICNLLVVKPGGGLLSRHLDEKMLAIWHQVGTQGLFIDIARVHVEIYCHSTVELILMIMSREKVDVSLAGFLGVFHAGVDDA
jgi:hypothetical protein